MLLKKIVVPLDGSVLAEMVLPHAEAIARATDATLALVHVLEPHSSEEQQVATDPLNWHLRKAEANSYLEDVSVRLRDDALSVQPVLLEGRAAERITEFVREHKTDLIVLSSHGKSGLSGWNVSSVVQKVIMRASCSVMIIRAYQPPRTDEGQLQYRKIVVPLDGSRRAETVLPLVEILAERHHAETRLVHVVSRPEMPRRAPLSAEDATMADKIVERNYEEGEKYLSQLQSRLGKDVQTRLLVGKDVISSLQNYVEEENVDLVILSAHGYSGDSTRPYGSLVTSFITYGNSPLLIVQDLAINEIESAEAELKAAQPSDSGETGRTVVHARTNE